MPVIRVTVLAPGEKTSAELPPGEKRSWLTVVATGADSAGAGTERRTGVPEGSGISK